MGERPNVKQKIFNAWNQMSDKISELSDKISEFRKQYHDDIKIHVRAILVALFILMLLNFAWWFFAKFGWKFPSPLDYQSGLQVVVDVICAVVIAVSTIRLEKRWRDLDKKISAEEKKFHEDELISDRMHELNSIELKAFGYAISNADLVNDFLPCFASANQLPPFAISIVSSDSHKDLFPAHFQASSPVSVSICVGQEEFSIRHKFYNGALLLWHENPKENPILLNYIYQFLIASLYVHDGKTESKMKIRISVNLMDQSLIHRNSIQCDVYLVLHPTTSCGVNGKFLCNVIRHCRVS